MLYKLLAPMLERETGLPVVGFLPPMPDAAIESRHLGLKTAGEIADLQQKIQILTAAAQKNIDWPRLLALFDRPAPMAPAVQAAAPTVRIAVAQDEAFCFTYAETLESLAISARCGMPRCRNISAGCTCRAATRSCTLPSWRPTPPCAAP